MSTTEPLDLPEPLPDDYLAIIRRDDERLSQEERLSDPTRLLWDRHMLLGEVKRLRAHTYQWPESDHPATELQQAIKRFAREDGYTPEQWIGRAVRSVASQRYQGEQSWRPEGVTNDDHH
jgi:hypothetical protein